MMARGSPREHGRRGIGPWPWRGGFGRGWKGSGEGGGGERGWGRPWLWRGEEGEKVRREVKNGMI